MEHSMAHYESIGSLIKWIIKCRNKRIRDVANDMGIKYSTFSAQLINNSLTADTMLRLAAYLDIDLEWMSIVLGYNGYASAIDREMLPRMQSRLRAVELNGVTKNLDRIIAENPVSIPDVRRELLKAYRKNMYYLLDVLVPEKYHIFMISARDGTKYYVDLPKSTRGRQNVVMKRKRIQEMYEGYEALDILIQERKEK